MKQISPNYEIMRQAIVFSLKDTYKEYIKAVNDSLMYTGFDDNGNFFALEGQKERNEKVEKLNKEISRLRFKLEEIDNLILEEKRKL